MTNSSFANEDVMEDYLSGLLTDEVVAEQPVNRDSVARLLEQVEEKSSTASACESKAIDDFALVAPDQQASIAGSEIALDKTGLSTPVADVAMGVVDTLPDLLMPASGAAKVQDQRAGLQKNAFQALFFDVAGLTLAVPLIHLGGIHYMQETSQIFGKPDWFMGIMLSREEKLNTVDTARWVMPEKYDEKLAQSLDYKYLIMLGESGWGLSCERLINTVTLAPEDIKWREEKGKRPWLAGMVKQKMCALLDVEQLISMLDNGLTSNEQ